MKTPDEIKKGLETCSTKKPCASCPMWDECKEASSLKPLWDNALALIHQLEAQVPKWISVEERLPDRKQDWVLIIGKFEPKGDWTVPHVAEYREGVWLTNTTGWAKIEDLHIKVTHWMPLPEPPKEDEDE